MKTTTYSTIYFLIFFIIISCNQSKQKRNTLIDTYRLVQTGKILKLPVDFKTNIESPAMFQYDDGENEYLTFFNMPDNEIQFYNIETKKMERSITCNQRGPNATGRIRGFKVHSFDSLYICGGFLNEIFLLDFEGKIKKKYSYLFVDNKTPTFFTSYSRMYTPLIVKADKLFLTQSLSSGLKIKSAKNMPSVNTNVCLVLDENAENRFLPMRHPLAKIKGLMGFATKFSRDFNGHDFVYSFAYDHSVYVTSDHINIKKYNCPSKFIANLTVVTTSETISSLTFEKSSRDYISSENYWNLVYDKYRNVYYRFVKLKDKFKNGDDLMKLSKYPNNFSIIIIDKNFNVIGETKLPVKTYHYKDFFVGKKGLYLSINHADNPALDFNKLQFELIKLKKNEN